MGRVVVGAGVVNQGLPTCRRIAVTTCVGKQGLKPVGRVVTAGGVVVESAMSPMAVFAVAFRVVQKGSRSNGCIRTAGGVE